MAKSLLCMGLNRIKKKHGDITIKEWSKKSGVPESTLGRFLSSSLNIPNFPAVCAMLKCLGESIDDFYASLDAKIDVPVEALKLDAVPVEIVGDIAVDVPEEKAAIQELIIRQTEELQLQKTIVSEKDAHIELLEARLEMNERILVAIKALCSAQ